MLVPITILLAEDHALVLEGIRSLLQNELGILVVGEATNGREAVDLTRKLRPNVVVMDIAMPLLNGLEATRRIRRSFPSTKVLILSAHYDDAYIDYFNEVGASGYVTKQSSFHILAEAIREIAAGNVFYSQSISARLHQSKSIPRQLAERRRRIANLTSRQKEVVQLIAEGGTNKRIAFELGISLKTVEKHRQSLMTKLQIHNIAGLTRYALAAGIVENSIQRITTDLSDSSLAATAP